MATLVRWDPFRELAQIQNEFGRLLGTMQGAQPGNGTQSWVPALDVWETDDEVVYAFDLPGIPKDSISIEFEDGALTVSAERERSQEVSKDRYFRLERRYGTFARTIGLPQGIDENAVKANFQDGVLEVRVQKPKAPEPRRIQIGGSASGQETIEGKAKKA